ncbi:hypothetical protein LX36DRAFT_672974 [Colletotrichum falcatum]|nr:hypothetical protein LX36DRAFT_672974 [Colletotrichum falcatum]
MHLVDERILATWQIDSLEAILGPDLSPATWSLHLRKRLLALSRLVPLQRARDLLKKELSARLNDPVRSRSSQRRHLCDIDVLHVVNAQQKENPRPDLLDEDDQLDPITPAPVSTRSTRRKRARAESPDQADARPPLPTRSPDLSTPFTLSRPPGRQARDDYPLQLLAHTAANHKAAFVPILPRAHRPMRVPPVTYCHAPAKGHAGRTSTIVVDPISPKSPPQSRDAVAVPPPDDPSPLPNPEAGNADEHANAGTTRDDAANDAAAVNDSTGNDTADIVMASDDGADEARTSETVDDDTAASGNYTDTTMVDTASVEVTPRPQTTSPLAFKTAPPLVDTALTPLGNATGSVQGIPRPATATPSGLRSAKPRVDTVFARLRNEREHEIADLEGEVQKLRYEVDVKRTQVQLYRHNYAQARRRAERARGLLDDLAAEEEEVGRAGGEYDAALAELKALGERYPCIFDAEDEEVPAADQKWRQTPRTPGTLSLSQTPSLGGTPGGRDFDDAPKKVLFGGGGPKALLGSLRAAVEAQKARRTERRAAAQEARAAAEQSLKEAEAAIVGSLAEAEDAEASVAGLLGSLGKLEKYLDSVKEQAVLLTKVDCC